MRGFFFTLGLYWVVPGQSKYHYSRKKTRALKYSLAIPVILNGSVEGFKVFLLTTIGQKKTLQFGNRDSEGFIVNRLCVTDNKSNENEN